MKAQVVGKIDENFAEENVDIMTNSADSQKSLTNKRLSNFFT